MNYPSPGKITDVNFVPETPNYFLVPENKSEIQLFKIGLQHQAFSKELQPINLIVTNRRAHQMTCVLFDADKNYLAANFGNEPGITVLTSGEAGADTAFRQYVDILADIYARRIDIGFIRITRLKGNAIIIAKHQSSLEGTTWSNPLYFDPNTFDTQEHSLNIPLILNGHGKVQLSLPPHSSHEITFYPLAKADWNPQPFPSMDTPMRFGTLEPLIGRPQKLNLSPAVIEALQNRNRR